MENRKYSAHLAFTLFTAAVMLALVLPDLLQHGMFMDGTQYAVVSKNFAEGKSTFWFPYLSSSWEKQGQNYFLEHPPLIYFLQSVFFKICNGSFLSERLYCFVTIILSVFFIIRIWKELFEKESKYRAYYWLPVLLWIIIPSVSWSYKNNMHENTLSVFVLAAVYFILKAKPHEQKKYLFIILAGILIFFASLSKGVPGLFPICVFVIVGSCFRNITWKQIIGNTLFLVMIPFLAYFLIIYFSEDAKQSLSFYLKERLMYRISNNHQVDNRFVVFFWLICDLIVPIILLLPLAIYKVSKSKKAFQSLEDANLKRHVIMFGLIGLAGVIPLSFTHVQRAVYFVPALPFFAIMFSLLFFNEIKELVDNITARTRAYKFVFSISIVGFLAVIFYSCAVFGSTSRDNNELSDVRKIAAITGTNKEVHTSGEIYSEWGFQFYLLRYNNITLDPRKKEQPFVLWKKEENFNDTNYRETGIVLTSYKLLKRIN